MPRHLCGRGHLLSDGRDARIAPHTAHVYRHTKGSGPFAGAERSPLSVHSTLAGRIIVR